MLLLKSNGGGVGGGTGDRASAREILMNHEDYDDDDDDDDSQSCSSDLVTPASASAPTRTLRNLFRKRHKSVTAGFVRDLNSHSVLSSGVY